MILFPASCARYLKVFRADLKQPPGTNGHEEGTGQSQALPVKTKRKKTVSVNFNLERSIISGGRRGEVNGVRKTERGGWRYKVGSRFISNEKQTLLKTPRP